MPTKKNSEYWKQRFDQVEQSANNRSVRYTKQLEKKYNTVAQELDRQINAWYQRIAVNNEVTITEARRLLSASELKEFKWTVEDYIKYGQQNAVDQSWMKELENASAKFHINKLEALKLECRQSVEQLFAGGQETMFDVLADTYSDTFYRSCFEIQKGIGVGFDVSRLDDGQVRTLLQKPWSVDGTNFSQKLWGNKRKLINTLDQELSRMVLTGESPQKIIANVRKAMDTSQFAAKRLVMTEQAYFASVAQKGAFSELDVEEYEIVATLDNRTSEKCQEMDGQHFPVKDMQPGLNAPPFHVFCRSTTCPYFNDEFTVDDKRVAKNEETGEWYEVPANMTYPEWKKSFVDGSDKSDLTEWTPQKTSSMKRDPANFRKSEPIEEPVKELTIEDINTNGSNILASAYESHRIKNGMTSVPYDELGDGAIDIVSTNYGKMSVESATAFNDAIGELTSEYDTPLQKIRTMTRDEFMAHGDSFAYVTHNYTVDSAELVINPTKCKDVSKLTDRIKELSEHGYCVQIPDELADRYVATHEFAHTLLNMEDKLNNKTNWLNADYDKIRKARKEISAIYDDYMKEVKQLTIQRDSFNFAFGSDVTPEQMMEALEQWDKHNDLLNEIKLSEYSLENADEFMAEAFAQGKIGVNKSKYSNAVLEIIDKYFKR